LPEITEIVMVRDGLGRVDDDRAVTVLAYETSPPVLLLDVTGPGDERGEHRVGLGDTFPVGAHTWRFEDIRFHGRPHDFHVTLRRVPPGAPPFAPPPLAGDRVWTPVTVRHPGPVPEAAIAQLEQEFGQALPPIYRRWLAENNGGIPAVPSSVPGLLVVIDELQPLLGIRPDEPAHDLRTGRLVGRRMFNRFYVVIACAGNGLYAVQAGGPGRPADTVVALENRARSQSSGYQQAGYANREDYISFELAVTVAPDVYSFEAYLQPVGL
jgi:hypothetical protein